MVGSLSTSHSSSMRWCRWRTLLLFGCGCVESCQHSLDQWVLPVQLSKCPGEQVDQLRHWCSSVCVCVCVCVCKYVIRGERLGTVCYTHPHTHPHTHTRCMWWQGHVATCFQSCNMTSNSHKEFIRPTFNFAAYSMCYYAVPTSANPSPLPPPPDSQSWGWWPRHIAHPCLASHTRQLQEK